MQTRPITSGQDDAFHLLPPQNDKGTSSADTTDNGCVNLLKNFNAAASWGKMPAGPDGLEGEEGHGLGPRAGPRLHDRRMPDAPGLLELQEPLHRRVLAVGGVDGLECLDSQAGTWPGSGQGSTA